MTENDMTEAIVEANRRIREERRAGHAAFLSRWGKLIAMGVVVIVIGIALAVDHVMAQKEQQNREDLADLDRRIGEFVTRSSRSE